MPNISEGWAIVIAAYVSVSGTVIALIFTQYFNHRQRITDFEYRHSSVMDEKKFSLYEEVISTLDFMRDPDTNLVYMQSSTEIHKRIYKYIHTLHTLFDRLYLYGSPDSRRILSSCVDEIQYMLSEAVDENIPERIAGSYYWSQINRIVRNTMIDFRELVTKEKYDVFENIKRPRHRHISKRTRKGEYNSAYD